MSSGAAGGEPRQSPRRPSAPGTGENRLQPRHAGGGVVRAMKPAHTSVGWTRSRPGVAPLGPMTTVGGPPRHSLDAQS